MLVSGSLLRAAVAVLYVLVVCLSSGLTYVFYSEPVLFAFVLLAVSMLVLSYPILCFFSITRCYDLEVRSLCQAEWIPTSVDIEVQKPNASEEKMSRLDLAFVHAYM